MAKVKEQKLTEDLLQKKIRAQSDLEFFINLVHPKRCLGNIHREVITWWTGSSSKSHQLLLLPRDHMKSALLAYRVVWELTKDPTLRILLISATSNLATKQLKFIKDILTSDTYRIFWPEMVNKDEAKREKWTEREISVDHPKRKEWSIRDPSIFTAGLTSNIVGLHCDIAALDDVVEQKNAYLEVSREKVKDQYSLLSSIETLNAREWVVGTRYHPNDLYATLMEMELELNDIDGNPLSPESLFDVKEYPVEQNGQFLWPRSKGPDGKYFGFDWDVLNKKKSQYTNKLYYRAQYYNDPHDIDDSPIGRENFQYYDRNYLYQRNGRWFFKASPLNIVAAVDFAFSTEKRADYTSLVVVGADGLRNYYVLDIDRFKTDRPSDYFVRILKLYEKWGFHKLRAEVTVAQKVIVNDLKENYVKRYGLALIIDEFRPSRWQGSKEERIMATLEPKYANRQMWHYQGGNCQVLEEELMLSNPPHDDVKDALSSAVDFVTAPVNAFKLKQESTHDFKFNARFGGVN